MQIKHSATREYSDHLITFQSRLPHVPHQSLQALGSWIASRTQCSHVANEAGDSSGPWQAQLSRVSIQSRRASFPKVSRKPPSCPSCQERQAGLSLHQTPAGRRALGVQCSPGCLWGQGLLPVRVTPACQGNLWPLGCPQVLAAPVLQGAPPVQDSPCVPFVQEVLDSQRAQASPRRPLPHRGPFLVRALGPLSVLWLQEGRGGLGFHKAQEDPEAPVHQGVQGAQAAQGDPANRSLPWALEVPSATGKAWVPPGGRTNSCDL